MADTFTLYKLIILYLLDKVNFPMSNAQLSEFILEKEYTDYFTVQTALSELSETGFLTRLCFCAVVRVSVALPDAFRPPS